MIDNEKLKAVTFVKDKIVQDEDLNSMFLTPYRCEDYFDRNKKLNDINEIKSGIYTVVEDKELYKSIYKDYRDYLIIDECKTKDNIINDYLYMNIRDLFNSSVIRFSSIYFPDEMIITNDILKDIPRFSFLDNDTVIRTSAFNIFLYLAKCHLYNYIGIVFSHISKTYYQWIDYLVSTKMFGNFEGLFLKMYGLAYEGTKPGDNISYDMKCTIINTVLREAMNGELLEIRKAMMLISDNVIAMIISAYEMMNNIDTFADVKPVFGIEKSFDDIKQIMEDNNNG